MKYALIGIVLLLLIGIGGLFVLGNRSQNGSAPGLVNGELAACPASPNCAASTSGTDEAQRVEPLPVSVWAQLPATVAAMGGQVTVEQTDYIAAEFTSNTFKFVDDLEFHRTGDEVQVRSASRVGYSDAGVNAARVMTLRQRLGL